MDCWAAVAAALVAAIVRQCVSLGSYSGYGKPPMHGDFEAQRHWQEITVNLPANEWYHPTPDNDLLYWGLDYPPLTAYHSWLCGQVAELIDPSWVALNASRGIETPEHKRFMRATALIADVLVYFPAAFLYCYFLKRQSDWRKSVTAGLILLSPGLTLIDHGHFQYNAVSLGLALWGVVACTQDYNHLGAIAFSLALNYKQMELYHALPFFFYLLGKSLAKPYWMFPVRVGGIGIVVIATFLVCWIPFLYSQEDALQVLHRLFPVGRGVFEDKVSNVWCSISIVWKLRNFDPSWVLILSTVSTLVAVLPSSIRLLTRPTKLNFILSLASSSLGFFLFSFQVHEKSILLAALPMALLLPHYPLLSIWFQVVASFSMYPLLKRDGVALEYAVVTLLFVLLATTMYWSVLRQQRMYLFVVAISFAGMLSLHALEATVVPPRRLPDLFPLVWAVFCCFHFCVFVLLLHNIQFSLPSTSSSSSTTTTAGHKLKSS
ncbi:dolichyl pyrophosphate Man9GlcNAc2 alpha-1,3-glucosyltransferase-like [Sycon ciliatum]|uniref:dolichyl pyrophosphate Man9GlcNAc2 alpha-1,3-glucosyltransferase-like n=1 Tax=Sycon ciliatum TaxID=27933 RepID=UPI0031F6B54B